MVSFIKKRELDVGLQRLKYENFHLRYPVRAAVVEYRLAVTQH